MRMLDRLVIVGVLVLSLACVGGAAALIVGSHMQRPKDRKSTEKENYPDDHLFV
jgi:hypothetical protein